MPENDYTIEGFADGAMAIQRDGLDILHMTVCEMDPEFGGTAASDAEFTYFADALQQAVDALDTTSSASRQHYIDTGRYLTLEETRSAVSD